MIEYIQPYIGGILSKDGKIFAYGSWRLNMHCKNQFNIYKSDTVFRYSGRDLGLVESDYPSTESHKIWMNNYYFSTDYKTDITKLIIETLDSKKIELDLNNCKTSVSINELSMDQVKNIGTIKLTIIGLGIRLLTIRRVKNKNT